MEAKELMIGDWVNYAGEPIQINGDAISNLEFNELNGIERLGYDPIPITPEILIKNGFRKENDFPFYVLEVDNNSSILSYDMEGHYVHVDDETMIDFLSCIYVHELQHIIRMLKINKEIELWK